MLPDGKPWDSRRRPSSWPSCHAQSSGLAEFGSEAVVFNHRQKLHRDGQPPVFNSLELALRLQTDVCMEALMSRLLKPFVTGSLALGVLLMLSAPSDVL